MENRYANLLKRPYVTLHTVISNWDTCYVLNRPNVIAVVQRITHPLTVTRNGKYCVKFKIIDESVGQNGFFVSCFNKRSGNLEDIRAGDIVCINCMKIEDYNGVPDGRVFDEADVFIFKKEDLSLITLYDDFQCTDKVRKRVQELKVWSETLTSCPEWVTALSSIRGEGEYHVVCQVLDVTRNGSCELQVTDGTVICRPDTGCESALAPATICQGLALAPYTLPSHIGHLVTTIVITASQTYYDVLKRGSVVHLCNVKAKPGVDGGGLRLTLDLESPPSTLSPDTGLFKDISQRLTFLKKLLNEPKKLQTIENEETNLRSKRSRSVTPNDASQKENKQQDSLKSLNGVKEGEERKKRRGEEQVESNKSDEEKENRDKMCELQSTSGDEAVGHPTDPAWKQANGENYTVFTEILMSLDDTGSSREDVPVVLKDTTGVETPQPELPLVRALCDILDGHFSRLLVSLVCVFPDPLHPLDWVIGVCVKGCHTSFVYTDLTGKESTTILPLWCPACKNNGRSCELQLGLHLELQVLDVLGATGRLAVSCDQAERFLHCSVDEFVRNEELRRSRAKLLSRHSLTVEPQWVGSRPLLEARVTRVNNILAVVDTALKLPSSVSTS